MLTMRLPLPWAIPPVRTRHEAGHPGGLEPAGPAAPASRPAVRTLVGKNDSVAGPAAADPRSDG